MREQLRYPGRKPFSKDERELFFGRNQDINQLVRLVELERLVVLYGKSGLGKTSLLNAGIIPVLEEEKEYQSHIIKFGSHKKYSNSPLKSTCEAIQSSTTGDGQVSLKPSLWNVLKQQQQGSSNNVLLVFDQFEDLFSYPKEEIQEFQKQLLEVFNAHVPSEVNQWVSQQDSKPKSSREEEALKPINIKVLLSVRYDSMHLMEKLIEHWPTLFDCSYELTPLNRRDAGEAILCPASYQGECLSPNFGYSPAAIDTILDFLTNKGREKVAGFMLQVVCQHIEQLVIQSKISREGGIITIQNRHVQNLQEVYANYYNQFIASFSNNKVERQLHDLMENRLIFSDTKHRVSLEDAVVSQRVGISPEVIQSLVDNHFIRTKRNRSGNKSYNISHSALIDPILYLQTHHKQSRKRNYILWVTTVAASVAVLLVVLIAFEASYYVGRQQEAIDDASHELITALDLPHNQRMYLQNKTPNEQIRVMAKQVTQTLAIQQQKDSIFRRALEEVKQELEAIKSQKGNGKFLISTLEKFEKQAEDIDRSITRLGPVREYGSTPHTTNLDSGTAVGVQNLKSLEIKQRESYLLQKQMGDQLFDRGEYSNAKAHYEEALIYRPKDRYLRKRLDQILKKEQQDGYQVSLVKADNLIEQQRYEEALAIYQQLSSSSYASAAISHKIQEIQDRQEEVSIQASGELMIVDVSNETYLVKEVPFTMIGIKGGSFMMGSPSEEVGRNTDEFEHQVNLPSFLIGQYEVTQKLWRAVMNQDPEELAFQGCDECPVENVSWYEAQRFIKKLNSMTGEAFRLPTEAEWEYTARAGTNTPFYTGDNINTQQVNYNGKHPYNGGAKGKYRQKTMPVGSFKPNPWGVYDMSGNVYEWCQDWYSDDYYYHSRQDIPEGPANGSSRVIRGGSWYNVASYCRVARRNSYSPGYGDNNIGFRIAKSVKH